MFQSIQQTLHNSIMTKKKEKKKGKENIFTIMNIIIYIQLNLHGWWMTVKQQLFHLSVQLHQHSSIRVFRPQHKGFTTSR